ncbi:hypothetical protein ATZ36_13940 [Candidatus Endomicrobiellum trichonymphae]|uniref:Uncharacterized protein n=1 Tax=Endomicrobium trichonymphae TaxID=1408204 RepID=A0A1E5IM77_ENDTX|nr:hypothetical protein ATZ36_13940 [Candidatus Endomicrobium trichonymphae]
MEYAEEHYDNEQIKRRGAQVNAKEVVKTKKTVATSFPDENLMPPTEKRTFGHKTTFPTATIAEEFYYRENLSYATSIESNRTQTDLIFSVATTNKTLIGLSIGIWKGYLIRKPRRANALL